MLWNILIIVVWYIKTSETYKTSSQKYIESFKVVRLLLHNKDNFLEPIPFDEKQWIRNFTIRLRNTRHWNILHPVFSANAKNQKKQPHIKTIFEFETVTNKTHKPYLVRYETEEDNRREFIGENCAEDMLNNLPYKNTVY